MLHERINLEDLKKFESIKLRLKKENIGIELSIIDDELLIDVEPSYQKPTKKHICEKEKFNHIMEECDKLDKKDIQKKCKRYDEKCYDPINSKKYVESLINNIEESDIDDNTELSIKIVKEYLKKNKVSPEKLCSIFKDIWLDDPVKNWCEEQEERKANPFEELLKITSNKNKASWDFKDINEYIKETVKNHDNIEEVDTTKKDTYVEPKYYQLLKQNKNE